jgi:hypothetical protein
MNSLEINNSIKNISIDKSNTIKLMAIVFMIIDHIGIVVFPSYTIFRIIGRIALPLFAYQLLIGYKNTKNFKGYMTRLGVFALISQLPYSLLFETTNLNIFFNLFFTLGILYSIDKKKYIHIFVIIALIILLKADYGLYLLLLTLIFKYTDNKILISSLFMALNILFVSFLIFSPTQIFSILALAPIFLISTIPGVKNLNKHLFYWFYPVHLMILLFYNLIFN